MELVCIVTIALLGFLSGFLCRGLKTPEHENFRRDLQTLIEEEGDSVEVLSEDEDAWENPAVIVCVGEWTEWEDRKFRASTLDAVFHNAASQKRLADRINTTFN